MNAVERMLSRRPARTFKVALRDIVRMSNFVSAYTERPLFVDIQVRLLVTGAAPEVVAILNGLREVD